MKAAVIALCSLALFVVAFILFMLAPLLMMLLVGGCMYGNERWGKTRRSKRRAGTTVVESTPGTARASVAGDTPFGFGGVAGEDL